MAGFGRHEQPQTAVTQSLFFLDGLFDDGSQAGDFSDEVGCDVAYHRIVDAGVAHAVADEVVGEEVGEEPGATVDGDEVGAEAVGGDH